MKTMIVLLMLVMTNLAFAMQPSRGGFLSNEIQETLVRSAICSVGLDQMGNKSKYHFRNDGTGFYNGYRDQALAR